MMLELDQIVANTQIERYDELARSDFMIWITPAIQMVESFVDAANVISIYGSFDPFPNWKLDVLAEPAREWHTVSQVTNDNEFVLISSSVVGPWTRGELDKLAVLDEWISLYAGKAVLKRFDWLRKVLAPSPLPTLTSISPTFTPKNGPGLELFVTGTNFVSTSVGRVNALDRVTEYISATQLKVFVTANDIKSPTGNRAITVFNPAPGGGVSNTLNLAVV